MTALYLRCAVLSVFIALLVLGSWRAAGAAPADIMALSTNPAVRTAGTSTVLRPLLDVGVMAVIAGALLLAANWWHRRRERGARRPPR